MRSADISKTHDRAAWVIHRMATWSPITRYGIAMALILAATAIRLALSDYLSTIPYALFLSATVAATCIGGLGAGLFAAGLATVVAWIVLVPPSWTLLIPTAKDWVGLTLLAVTATGVSLVIHAYGKTVARLFAAYRRARERATTLEQRIDARTLDGPGMSDRPIDSERLFRLLINGVVDYAITILDPDGRVTSWNTGAQRMKGYGADEIIGHHLAAFYTEADQRDGVPHAALETAAQTGRFESEGWLVHKDGTHVWAHSVIDAIRDDAGVLIGFARISRELTERRHSEDQLRQTQKMEAIGRLAGGVAHDFNNLLHVVLGNLQSVQLCADRVVDAALGRALRERATNAARAAERATTLTRRLLAFARQQPIDPKPTDVDALIAGMSDLLRQALGETIAVETGTTAGLWRISVDAHQLESTLLNLAVNARDAMPRGGTLSIETANTVLDEAYAADHGGLVPGQYVMVAVSDTGVGMTRQVAAKAFEPFFTTKEIGQGTGLGLSQVHGFVKQSDGHVKIYSEPGHGATLRLYFPRLRGEMIVESAAPPAEIRNLKPGNGEIILVVEDDADVRALTCRMLVRLGYGVASAGDSVVAMYVIRERADIRLMLTDVSLSGELSGTHLAGAVRVVRPGLPVLFTSGHPEHVLARDGRLDPGIDLLVRPFTASALGIKLEAMLRATGAAR